MTITLSQLASQHAPPEISPDAKNAYRGMILQLVESGFLPDDAEEIREAAGKSFDDLKDDARRFKERKEDAEKLARANVLDERAKGLFTKEKELQAAYREVVERTDRERRAAAAPLRELNAKAQNRELVGKAKRLREEGRNGLNYSADPAIKAEIDELFEQIEQLRGRYEFFEERAQGEIVYYIGNRNPQRADVDYLEEKIRKAEHVRDNAPDNNKRSSAESAIANHRKSIEKLRDAENEKRELSAKMLEARGKISELERTRLDWTNAAID